MQSEESASDNAPKNLRCSCLDVFAIAKATEAQVLGKQALRSGTSSEQTTGSLLNSCFLIPTSSEPARFFQALLTL
jgi:hypothetical protein